MRPTWNPNIFHNVVVREKKIDLLVKSPVAKITIVLKYWSSITYLELRFWYCPEEMLKESFGNQRWFILAR